MILRLDVADAPGPSVIVLGLMAVRGPLGDEDAVRSMLPEKPPRLFRVRVVVPESPGKMVIEDGLAVMLRSTTWTVIVTECKREPLVAVTMIA